MSRSAAKDLPPRQWLPSLPPLVPHYYLNFNCSCWSQRFPDGVGGYLIVIVRRPHLPLLLLPCESSLWSQRPLILEWWRFRLHHWLLLYWEARQLAYWSRKSYTYFAVATTPMWHYWSSDCAPLRCWNSATIRLNYEQWQLLEQLRYRKRMFGLWSSLPLCPWESRGSVKISSLARCCLVLGLQIDRYAIETVCIPSLSCDSWTIGEFLIFGSELQWIRHHPLTDSFML